jgi:O-methyltransferase involved in polyketide biosynthesis
MYLPAEAQDRLFVNIGDLSAPGSRIAAETMREQASDRREELQERFGRVAEKLGMNQLPDIADLTYDDPDRADLAEWLNTHGWQASDIDSQQEMRRLDRWLDIPFRDGDDSFSRFVFAERA